MIPFFSSFLFDPVSRPNVKIVPGADRRAQGGVGSAVGSRKRGPDRRQCGAHAALRGEAVVNERAQVVDLGCVRRAVVGPSPLL